MESEEKSLSHGVTASVGSETTWKSSGLGNTITCKLKNKNQLDATYCFIVLLKGSTFFGHYYAHHQELETIMLITTLVISFLVCCRLEVRSG